MKHKLLIISALFIIFSCSKDDDIGSPEAIFCNCIETTEVYNTVTRERTESTRAFTGECNLSGTEQREELDFIITTRTQCTR